jgi:hypothetical protein
MAPTDRVTESTTVARFQDDDSSINSAILDILPENIPNTIITKTPEERFRLGYWSVIALVVNRVIGNRSHLPRLARYDTDYFFFQELAYSIRHRR